MDRASSRAGIEHARAQLAQVMRALREQDAALAAAHAGLDPRRPVEVTPARLCDLAALCELPEQRLCHARARMPAPAVSALRC